MQTDATPCSLVCMLGWLVDAQSTGIVTQYIAVVQGWFPVLSFTRVWVPLTKALGQRVAHRLLYAHDVFV